eukprot:TRINITY_DN3461_c0_g1_i1.p1 TRINITY_DN3461_c0_g1~~TRINITY_DN3461_c0_g1_i1.p1  ORF type:complete len:174 (+),score=25.15 TRINITY_DN3461_c0_g1_i1:72-524(+)
MNKALLCGDEGVGKTSLILAAGASEGPDEVFPTTTAQTYIKYLLQRDEEVLLHDFPKGFSSHPRFISGILLLVYDVTNPASYDRLGVWLSCYHTFFKNARILATKTDLPHDPQPPSFRGIPIVQVNRNTDILPLISSMLPPRRPRMTMKK